MKRRILINTLAVLVTAAMLLPVVLPVVQAEGGSPSVRDPYPRTADNTVRGLALDGTGRYAGMVVTSSQQSCALGICSPTGKSDWYGFDFGPLPRFEGSEYSDKTTFTNASQLVAVASGDGVATGGYFATAGPGTTFRFGRFSDLSFPWKKVLDGGLEFKGIALSKNGNRLAVLTYDVTARDSRVTVYETQGSNEGNELWTYKFTNEYGLAMAPGRDSGALVVATNKNIFSFTFDRAPTTQDVDFFRRSMTGHVVTDLKVSDSASETWIAAVTAGTAGSDPTSRLFYMKNSKAGFDNTQSATLQGRGTSVDINTDGASVAAGTSTGRAYKFERTPDGLALSDSFPRLLGNAAPVAAVDFDASGTYLMVAAGGSVLAFHRDFPAAPIWSLAEFGGGKITKFDFAENGKRFVAATDANNIYVFDLKTSAKATADPKTVGRFVEPRQFVQYTLTVANTGNTVDNYDFRLRNVPAGWNIPDIPALRLSPGESRKVTYNVTTADTAEPGSYAWDIETRSRSDPNPISTLRFWSNITNVASIRVDANPRSFTLEPGDTQSFAFTISNNGNTDALVNMTKSQALTPPGTTWGVTLERDQVIVKRGEPARLTGTISIPAGVAKGVTNVITLNLEYNGIVRATLPLTVRVSPDYRIGLAADKTIVSVEAGGISQVILRLTNNGNAEDRVDISAKMTDSQQATKWTITIPQSRITIPAGGSKTIPLNLEASPDAGDSVMTVTARGTGEEPQTLQISAKVTHTVTGDDSFFTPATPVAWLGLAMVAVALLRRRARG